MASANNSYDLKLPSDKMDLFVSNKYQILNESVQHLLASDESVNDVKMVANK
jgi:membrane-bound lytic murein transglycosylase D